MVSPNPKSFNEGYLDEKDGHKVYFAEYGNPAGLPILVIHGGPGGKSKPKFAARFDLEKYHVIAFDQRGCGQSLPLGEIKNNTTADLVADIERLRTHLKIDNWYVSGGSWGATIALLYSESFSSRVKGLLISTIFLANQKNIEWEMSTEGGLAHIFPDLLAYRPILSKQFESGDEATAKNITAKIMNWQSNIISSQQNTSLTCPEEVTEENIASTKISLSYMSNNYFLTPNEIIKNIDRIKDIPTIIVHGRYDLMCTLSNAWELHNHLTNSELVILPNSNHLLTADGDVARSMAYKYFLTKRNL